MKIVCSVGRVEQITAKPTDITKPCPVVWTVRMATHPHIGDIELRSEHPKFAEWASTLKAGQVLEVQL